MDGSPTKAAKLPLPLARRAETAPRPAAAHTAAQTPAAEAQAASNLAVQALLGGGTLRFRLTVNRPDDPDEREADRVADAAVSDAPTPIRRKCASCAAGIPCGNCEDEPVRLKRAPAASGPAAAPPSLGFLRTGGRPLPPMLRRDFEARLGADLGAVRLHDGNAAGRATAAFNARAFALGRDIAFAPGEFAPETRAGRHLLAHELAHTLQPPRPGGGAPLRRLVTCSVAGPPAPDADTDRVVKAVRDGEVGTVVDALRGKSVPALCGLRTAVDAATGDRLERWLLGRRNSADTANSVNRATTLGLALVNPIAAGAAYATNALLGTDKKLQASGARAEEGVRLLLPALPLIDRLELYDEVHREIEQAQLDVIRAASLDERTAARSETARLGVVYARMGVKEEYDARLLIDPTAKYDAAAQLLARAPGIVSDDEDLVFDAIWALTPPERRSFYDEKTAALKSLLSEARYKLLGTLAHGTEAEALVARLREATEGRIDDHAAVNAVVDRAVALLAEQRHLRATAAAESLPPEERATANKRLAELGDLEALVRFAKGAQPADSFLGRLADAAGDPDAFGVMTRKLGGAAGDPAAQRQFAFDAARQRILMAAGLVGADEAAIRNAILEARAPLSVDAAALPPVEREQRQTAENTRLRTDLLNDEEVKAVISRLAPSARTRVRSFATADAFVETKADLTVALNDARWGDFFRTVLRIAQRDDWRQRFEATASDPFDTYARVHGGQRAIMLRILADRRIPTELVLAFTGDVAVLRTTLAGMDEGERGRLRLGYLLARTKRAATTDAERAALAAWTAFEANLHRSQTTLGVTDTAGIEAVLDAALGSEPTEAETSTAAGRFQAAALMYERQQARLDLRPGASALFTETDETMQAAAREFGARWLMLRDRQPPGLTLVEFAVLAALHDRFSQRGEEFTEASNTAGEVAGMVAATVAGIIIVTATGGVTAPAVIAAAAAGASARVVTREMFGGDYYNPAGGDAARDALLGAIDAALAVVGASLGAKGAELVGLGGRALLANAARVGGEVAEQASGRLAHRVASHAVQAAIDGAFTGFVSEAANAMTDARTWRRGIWAGLVRTGRAALLGGLLGLGAGGIIGGALPIVGAGLRSAADRLLGASVERSLARAGATEALEAARAAVRQGNMDEARRLFGELERHLTAEEANLLWRDLTLLAESATRIEEPITLLGQRHTLRLVDGAQGSFFVLCSWCTRVRDILAEALSGVDANGPAARRLNEMIGQLERMEENIASGKISRKKAEDRNALETMLRILSEGEELVGATLERRQPLKPSVQNWTQFTNNPAIASRAEELYQAYLEELMYARRNLFRGNPNLKAALEEEARARALNQARREVAPGALELDPAAPARATVDQLADIPFGFYDRAGFDRFARRLNAALNRSDSRLVLEGSAVTGRRFERIVDFQPTAAPFGFGRLSDLDVAIVSDSLFELAKARRIPLSGEAGVEATMALRPADLAALDLTGFAAQARQAALDATGIAYGVEFKIRSSHSPTKALGLNLPQ